MFTQREASFKLLAEQSVDEVIIADHPVFG
jgi:hypothetical protein